MSDKPNASEIQAIKEGGPLATQILRKYVLGRDPEEALRKLADDGGAREREPTEAEWRAAHLSNVIGEDGLDNMHFDNGTILTKEHIEWVIDFLRAAPKVDPPEPTKAFSQGFEAGFFCGQKADPTGPLTQRIVEAATGAWIDARNETEGEPNGDV